MAKKTNKTSHVLNLLTNSAPAEEADNTASGSDKKGDIQSHNAAQTKVTVVDEGSRNDRVSQDILNKLSEELADEVPLAEEEPVSGSSRPAPVQIPANSQKAAETAPAADALTTAPATEHAADAPAPEPAAKNAADASATESTADVSAIKPGGKLSDQLQDDEFHFINVMEELIMQHDLDEVLKQYNVCTCARCKADVCALTLTGLPAKYVVAATNSLSPILNYYKNRYRVSILAELSKACNTVREHPHHKR